jgi:hypothetical protein
MERANVRMPSSPQKKIQSANEESSRHCAALVPQEAYFIRVFAGAAPTVQNLRVAQPFRAAARPFGRPEGLRYVRPQEF